MIAKLISIIKPKNKRSAVVGKNAIGSLIVKSISIVVGFASVRLYLDYVGTENYGVWLTISSFVSWFTFFEFGLGNGLRNKLSQAITKKEFHLAKIYVSTTYFLLFIIVLIFVILFAVLNRYINWQSFINAKSIEKLLLYKVTNIVFLLFFVQFMLKLISSVFLALQKTTIAYAINPISNLISYIVVLCLSKFGSNPNLLKLSLVLSITPVIFISILSIIFYSGRLKSISPSFKFIQLKYSKDLLGLGLNFFLVQIAGLILFQSSNIIIIKMLGSEQVVKYNVAFKLFSTMEMFFSLLIAPLWSAYTEAWELKDYSWIRNSVRRNLYVWAGMVSISFLILLISSSIYRLWIGNDLVIPFNVSLFLFIYFSLRTFGSIYVSFLNGLSVLKLQFIFGLIGALIFIPLAYSNIKFFNLGIVGLTIAMIIGNFYGPFIAPFQYIKIMKQKKDINK